MSDGDFDAETNRTRQFYSEQFEKMGFAKEELEAAERRLELLERAVAPKALSPLNARKAWLRDGSRDTSVGAAGEREEPLDHRVRDLSALAYLVATCNLLGIDGDGEWDAFMYARAIHRRVRALNASESMAAPGAGSDRG